MELKDIRNEIDQTDDQILSLFLKRMNLSQNVADYKAENNIPIVNTGREREILSRITSLSGDGLDGYARILFSTLFDLSRSYQSAHIGKSTSLAKLVEKAISETPIEFPKKAVVACQGIEGAYSQQACDKVFSFADILYFKSFDGVFGAVEKGLCQYGVLPIENSSHGSVNEVYDLMRDHSFYIVHSTKLHIKHNLLAKPGTKLTDIREVISHEQAIGQCSAFLASFPDVTIKLCENTAIAAKLVSESDRTDIAAISSESCTDMYGLEIIKSHIHNTDNNYTRFIVISKAPEIYPGSNRISIMFAVPNRPGSLSRIMSRFSCLDVNLSKLESRPMEGANFEYVFYTDMDASIYSKDVISLLCELEQELKFFVFLGGYTEA